MTRRYAPGEIRGLTSDRAFAAAIARLSMRRDGGAGVSEIRISETEEGEIVAAQEVDAWGTVRWSQWPAGSAMADPYASMGDNDQTDTSDTGGDDR